MSSNWSKLKPKIVSTTSVKKIRKSKRSDDSAEEIANESVTSSSSTTKSVYLLNLEKKIKDKLYALDCEMVGIGPEGKLNALARCSVVDFDGNVAYDKIVKPKGYVTDFRTKYSGIRKSDLRKEKDNVVTLEECQEFVAKLLKGKILVGHALKNDFAALMLSHPRSHIRDTSHYRPYMRLRNKYGKYRPRALRDLAFEFLGKKIQEGEHNSVIDAQTTLELYKREMEAWERSISQQKKGMIEKSTSSLSSSNKSKKGISSNQQNDDKESDQEDGVASVGSNEPETQQKANEEIVIDESLLDEVSDRQKKKAKRKAIEMLMSAESKNVIAKLMNIDQKVSPGGVDSGKKGPSKQKQDRHRPNQSNKRQKSG